MDVTVPGFVSEYAHYAARLTDAPAEYHVFTALTLLGAAAARVRIPYGGQMLPPVLWTVLVGRSAYYRKTTAVEIGRRVLAHLNAAQPTPLLYGSERISEAMRDSGRLLAIDDFADLLFAGPCRRLAQLGDSGARLSLLAGAGTAQLAGRLSAADLSSGLLARFCLVVPGEKERWLAMPGKPADEAEQALAAMLAQAGEFEGQACFDDCRSGLSEWGRAMVEWLRAHDSKDKLDGQIAAGLASRTEPVLLKLAALVEMSRRIGAREVHPRRERPDPAGVSERVPSVEVDALVCTRDRASDGKAPGAGQRPALHNPAGAAARASDGSALRVSAESFEIAARLERFLRDSFEALIGREIRDSNTAQHELSVLARVARRPGISRRKLQQMSHLDAARLRSVLLRLAADGRLDSVNGGFYAAGDEARRSANVSGTRANA